MMDKVLENTRQIYSALQDEISKEIFIARLSYSVTGDIKYVRDIPMHLRNLNADIRLFAQKLQDTNQYNLVVFGAGANGSDLVRLCNNLHFLCFIDNYKQDSIEKKTGLPIYSLSDYKKKYGLNNTKFVVAVYRKDYVQQIIQQLKDNGVNQKDIIYISDWRNNSSQYFDLFIPHEHESFVDCGCYDGSTAYRFAGWCAEGGVTYDKIWSFEPDQKSYARCKEILKSLGRCQLYSYGISDKKETVSFMANGYENARIIKDNSISESAIQSIEVISLDELLKDEKVTLIKMDIEGAEYDALRGAEQIIRKQKPRLAISVYHNPNHIIEIPKLLLSFQPDYKFYIRHYSLLANEIVLYAE